MVSTTVRWVPLHQLIIKIASPEMLTGQCELGSSSIEAVPLKTLGCVKLTKLTGTVTQHMLEIDI